MNFRGKESDPFVSRLKKEQENEKKYFKKCEKLSKNFVDELLTNGSPLNQKINETLDQKNNFHINEKSIEDKTESHKKSIDMLANLTKCFEYYKTASQEYRTLVKNINSGSELLKINPDYRPNFTFHFEFNSNGRKS